MVEASAAAVGGSGGGCGGSNIHQRTKPNSISKPAAQATIRGEFAGKLSRFSRKSRQPSWQSNQDHADDEKSTQELILIELDPSRGSSAAAPQTS
jgi:hypothetical protein